MWYKLKRIMMRPNGVEKQVRPSWWQPWANTVLYCPLKDDILDHSWNHTMTMTTSTYWTVAKDSTGFYYFNWWYISSEAYFWPITAWTLSTWVKKSSSKSWWDNRFTWSVSTHYKGSSPFHCWLAFNFGGYSWQNWTFNAGATSWTTSQNVTWPTMWSWELWTMTYDNTVWAKFYRNWTYENSFSNTNNLRNDSLPTFIWATNPYTDQYLDWYLSDVIIEDKARTAQEIADYYNLTKWNYWIS